MLEDIEIKKLVGQSIIMFHCLLCIVKQTKNIACAFLSSIPLVCDIIR